MSTNAAKFIPTAVVLAASAACAWPYVGSSSPAPDPKPAAKGAEPKTKEIPLARLKPTPPPRPGRDPFSDPEAAREAARARIGATLKMLAEKTKPANPRPRSAARPRATVVAKPVEPPKPPPEVDPRKGLTLNATSAGGPRGVAVINGHSYTTGEWFRPPEAPDDCELVEVHARDVVLAYKGKRLTLAYPDPAAAGAPPRGPAAAKPDTVAASDDGAAPPSRRPGARKKGGARN